MERNKGGFKLPAEEQPSVRILLIGVNHRTAGVEVRERLAFSPQQVKDATASLLQCGVVKEAVVLSTCNRSEVYAAAPDAPGDQLQWLESFFLRFHNQHDGDLGRFLYRSADRDAVRHLFRVASGLDSLLLGEAEILGQVKQAYKVAMENGATGAVLHRLFQNALESGKRVRTHTDLGARPMSVAFASVKLAEQVFGKLGDQLAVVVGAGAVAEQVADHLRDRGIGKLFVVNRSRERGETLAQQVNGEYHPWQELEHVLEQSDIAVTSVSAEEPVIDAARMGRVMRARGNRDVFLIDLGLPRNITSEVGALYNVFLYNLNDLTAIVEENRTARQKEIPRAEAIVAQQVSKFQMWLTTLEVVELAFQLREKMHQEREEILHARMNRIGHLTPDDRRRAAQLMGTLIDRILQEPSGQGRDPHIVLHHSSGELQKLLRLVGEQP